MGTNNPVSFNYSACVVSKVTDERGAGEAGRKEDLVSVQFRLTKMLPLSLSLLLGWTEGEGKCSSVTTSLTQPESASVFHFVYTELVPSSVVKAQSRRQSGLVCSLLVVSLLLSPAVGGEGELSDLGVAVCT